MFLVAAEISEMRRAYFVEASNESEAKIEAKKQFVNDAKLSAKLADKVRVVVMVM